METSLVLGALGRKNLPYSTPDFHSPTFNKLPFTLPNLCRHLSQDQKQEAMLQALGFACQYRGTLILNK